MAQPQEGADAQQYDAGAYDYYGGGGEAGGDYGGYYGEGATGQEGEYYYRQGEEGYAAAGAEGAGAGYYEGYGYDEGTYGATSDATTAQGYDAQGNPMQYLYENQGQAPAAAEAGQEMQQIPPAAQPQQAQAQVAQAQVAQAPSQVLQQAPADQSQVMQQSQAAPAQQQAQDQQPLMGASGFFPSGLNLSHLNDRSHFLTLSGKSPGTALEEYEPHSEGWLADLSMATGLSLGFRMYMVYLLYSSLVLYGFIGFDYMFATLYRAFSPPDRSVSTFAQSTAYLCIFLPLSFLIVAIICVCVDMIRDYWTATKADSRVWGYGVWEKKAPWPLYGTLVVLTFFVPLIWAFGVTMYHGDSIFYFFSFYFYIAQGVTMFIVILQFIWLWFRAAREKGRALARRQESPDERPEVAKAYLVEAGGQPDVLSSAPTRDKVRSWFRSDIVMREYGLDPITVKYMVLILGLCIIPIIVVFSVLATEGEAANWEAGWIVVAVIFFSLLPIIFQATTTKKRGVASITIMFLVGLWILFGIVGAGVSQNGGLVGVFLVLVFLTQGMLLRRREFTMTRRQVYHHFNRPFDEEYEQRRDESSFDNYCCCCRNIFYRLLCCFDVKKSFGWTHPEIAAIEKKERKARLSVRNDQNVLTLYWWTFALGLCAILAFGRLSLTWYSQPLADIALVTDPTAAVGNPHLPVCNAAEWINQVGSAHLNMYEISLLAALSYTSGNQGKSDFNVWFGQMYPTLKPNYPSNYPYGLSQASEEAAVQWVDYYDDSTDFHYIVLKGANRAKPWMRNMDLWGDSLTLQFAGVLAPHLLAWSAQAKAEFVGGISFIKKIYGGNEPWADVELYINSIRATSANATMAIVGHGFNGGIAQILAARHGIPAVTFDSPGIGYLYKKFSFSQPRSSTAMSTNVIAVDSARSLYSFIDKKSQGTEQTIPCGSSAQQLCGFIADIVETLYAQCGDKYQRTMKYT